MVQAHRLPVAVVSDDPGRRAEVVRDLRAAGFDVRPIEASELFEQLRTRPPLAVVIDAEGWEPESLRGVCDRLSAESGWGTAPPLFVLRDERTHDGATAAFAFSPGAVALRWPQERERLIGRLGAGLSSRLREEQFARGLEQTFHARGPVLHARAVAFVARELEASVCFVGRLEDDGTERAVRVLAAVEDGRPLEPFRYPLAATPCENVVAGRFCVHRDGVAALYPRDAWLAEHGIRAYMGEPLVGASGEVLGLLVACFRRPLAGPLESARVLFRWIAARLALELDRERALSALRDSERRFRTLLMALPDPALLVDLSGRVALATPAAAALFGRPEAQLVGTPIGTLLPEYEEGGARGEGGEGNGAVFRSTAGSVPVEVHVAPVDLDGLRHELVVARDLRDRLHVEQQIRRLNRTYALLSETNQTIVRSRGPREVYACACRAAVEAGGFALAWVGEVVGEGRLRIVEVAGVDAETERLLRSFVEGPCPDCVHTQRALATGIPQVCRDVASDPLAANWREAALARGYRSLASFPLRVEGAVVGTFNLYATVPDFFDTDEMRLLEELATDMGFALEVHEKEQRRREAERALRESEAWFRSLIENAPDMIHVIDRQGRLLYQSPSVQAVLGHRPEDRIGRSSLEIVHPESVETVRNALAAVVAEPGRTITLECRVRHADGNWREIESTGRAVLDADGQLRVVINSRDLTEKRRLERQLRQAQKLEAVGRLAGGVAHDFNNLLTVIMGQSDLCAASRDLAPALRERIEEIRRTALRAAKLTGQLLAFSRRQPMRVENLDLNEAVGRVVSLLERLIGEDIELVYEPAGTPLVVRVDRTMLEQVLMNLAINARDAMPTGGRLRIRTARQRIEDTTRLALPCEPGVYATVLVEDTGYGIADRDLPRLFEPFFTTKEPGKGTGLGLATVRSIVERHEGGIQVESEPGRGTSFLVALPLAGEPASGLPDEDAPAAQKGREAAGGRRILVVEDDASVRGVVVSILESRGYEVQAYDNATSALEALENGTTGRVDVLLTDLVMPGGIGGIELAQALERHAPHVPVIFMTGYSEEVVRGRLVPGPGRLLLHKPFLPAELEAVLERAFAERGSARD